MSQRSSTRGWIWLGPGPIKSRSGGSSLARRVMGLALIGDVGLHRRHEFDERRGAFAISDTLRPGAEIALLLRDGALARDELKCALDGCHAQAAFYLSCAGRGAELFGHEEGAFTDARQRKVGHIETAEGGTLLLDEIAEMPLECQPSLLRFLVDKKVTPLGGTRTIDVDVRVIATTNSDLEARVRRKAFRADLFYRSGEDIELPGIPNSRTCSHGVYGTHTVRRDAQTGRPHGDRPADSKGTRQRLRRSGCKSPLTEPSRRKYYALSDAREKGNR